MLVLLDENLLSRKLKLPIIDAGHSVFNVDNVGWRGTKDQIYEPDVFEVEFIDSNGRTYALETLSASVLMILHHQPRELAIA
jgi:Domain of unknown function (DUF4926)